MVGLQRGGRLLTPADKLANGIRLRHQRSVDSALRDGACPNAQVPVTRDENFGTPTAPVIYLAIYYDMPDTVRQLAQMGAYVHHAVQPCLTPRAHAAWLFRWQCVDMFDLSGQVMMDDETVLSVITNHWSEPKADAGLEEVFFHRLDRVVPGFSMTPDLAFGVLVGVLCGWEGYRVAQMHRLLDNVHFQAAGKQLRQALYQSPQRFAPHYAKMHRQVQKFLGEQPLPDTALEMIAAFDIPLAPPPEACVNAEALSWLEKQQARVDTILCRKTLDEQAPAAQEGGRRGRL